MEFDRKYISFGRKRARYLNEIFSDSNLNPWEFFQLAITRHYSQCPSGQEPIDVGALLAHNGKVKVYRA
jgi:hypothetical protein